MRYISPQNRAPRPAGEGKVSEPVDFRSPVSGVHPGMSFYHSTISRLGVSGHCNLSACMRHADGSKQIP
jgi:hypothetical protein